MLRMGARQFSSSKHNYAGFQLVESEWLGAKLKAQKVRQAQDSSLSNGGPSAEGAKLQAQRGFAYPKPVSQAQRVRACTSAEG